MGLTPISHQEVSAECPCQRIETRASASFRQEINGFQNAVDPVHFHHNTQYAGFCIYLCCTYQRDASASTLFRSAIEQKRQNLILKLKL